MQNKAALHWSSANWCLRTKPAVRSGCGEWQVRAQSHQMATKQRKPAARENENMTQAKPIS